MEWTSWNGIELLNGIMTNSDGEGEFDTAGCFWNGDLVLGCGVFGSWSGHMEVLDLGNIGSAGSGIKCRHQCREGLLEGVVFL